MSSLDEPPLSLMGITYVNEHECLSITSLNTSTRLLAALPPEKTTILRLDGDADGLSSTFNVGKSDMIENWRTTRDGYQLAESSPRKAETTFCKDED